MEDLCSSEQSMTSNGFLQTESLTRVYSTGAIRVVALDAVTLSVDEGEFVGVTGASGSGKSTLMNLLGGLDSPTSGSIEVQGKRISELGKEDLALYRRYQVGMIFQSFNLVASYDALENVAFPLLFAGVARSERNSRAAEMLEKVGLSERRNHRPSELSGGEQQRVAIARALINRPKILLADEPTGNTDSKTSRQIMHLLSELNGNHGLTVIMISHEEVLLAEFAGRIIRLCDGRTVNDNDMADDR
jgi:putative ABC transport system ATP-binding protein